MDVSRPQPNSRTPHPSAEKVCPRCGAEYPANARFCEIDGTALRFAAGGNDLEGSIVADRYHILKKLGEGGMGQVYLAEHVKMGRKSALKVMHPGMVKDADAISRFNREAANASRINHPNVAAVYDFGETRTASIYLAMEFVDGAPLRDADRARTGRCPRAGPPRSCGRRPTRSPSRTTWASCTAISSPTTS